MSDFTSEFWSWFIIVPTVGGILGLFALIYWLSHDFRPKKGEEVKTMGHVWDEDLEEYNNPLPMWWLNMFYITLVFGVVYLILFPGLGSFQGILGWSQEGQYEQEIDAAESRYGPLYEQFSKTPIPDLVENPEAMKMGERLYLNYCTVCHGSDARGFTGYPNLRDSDWLFGSTPADIEITIGKGRVAMMPAWEDSLKAEGVEEVTEYVLSMSGRTHDAAKAEAGKAKYAVCAGCHGMDGKGVQAMGAPNLTDGIWLYGGSKEAITESIAKGRQGKMPAHEEFLGKAKVHLLTAYIYGLSGQSAQ